MNVGPMLNGYSKGALTGAGSVLWHGRELYATGEIDDNEFMDYIARGYVFCHLKSKSFLSLTQSVERHQ